MFNGMSAAGVQSDSSHFSELKQCCESVPSTVGVRVDGLMEVLLKAPGRAHDDAPPPGGLSIGSTWVIRD